VTSAPKLGIKPLVHPEVLPVKTGYIKVRLNYLTPEPKHIDNITLQGYGAQSPYLEEIRVLLPLSSTFDSYDTMHPAFDYLKQCGILHPECQLFNYKFVEEDNLTLAYVIPRKK
jgi:hypothetical protein